MSAYSAARQPEGDAPGQPWAWAIEVKIFSPSIGPGQRVDGVLGMGHEPEDVAGARCVTPAMSFDEPLGLPSCA